MTDDATGSRFDVMGKTEQMARAMCEADGHDPDALVIHRALPVGAKGLLLAPSNDPTEAWRLFTMSWRLYVSQARAALLALRIPTQDMVGAGYIRLAGEEFSRPREPMNAWPAMVDAILAEKEP